MSNIDARLAAAELLIETLENKRMLDEALMGVESYHQLEGPDRGFARAMASAALRQLGRIDRGITPLLNRPLKEATPAVRALLRIGAAQSWVLCTPAHAAVGETVNTAKAMHGAKGAAGFLNAVLRKVANDRSRFDAVPPSKTWPEWLGTAFEASVGSDGLRAIARAQMQEPLLHLTARSEDGAALAAQTGGAQIGPATVSLSTGTVEAIAGYEAGDWWVQDLAAALPVSLLAPKPDEHILDICAAPGGKTLQIAASGAKVTAIDRSKRRLQRVHENLARTNLDSSVEVIAANAETWRPDALADGVLLDAPCSALGTLRRHPEGAWIKDPGAIARFPDIQRRLLRAAADMVKPGGRVVYCVCTPLAREGTDVIDTVINDGIYERSPFTGILPTPFEHCVTERGDVLTIPSDELFHDAFFVSVLRRA